MSDEGLARELNGRFKEDWEKGGFDRLIPAFIFCAWNDLKMPPWLRDAVLDELHYSYQTRPRGGPMARTGAVQDHWDRKHATRHGLMRMVLDQQARAIEYGIRSRAPNQKEAAQEVRRILAHENSFAKGSTGAIIESYKLLENRQD